ncbi:Rrf2 family transcriptional regulator [Stakelama saccharophila]|uniref:Rrf2 family transcriptional regulator n=1 Tax=Stakelama saccharophila TaxID=3075605 RepID=A0ABZ0B8M9_9SPHN|nr:Rrf2 family transcriptional regulator [Stakelama sp. W311]WNO53659.1 Rrf2 family transcriptional regulator [Stakelama sp. W311]
MRIVRDRRLGGKQISRNHLTKVVHGLARAGFVDSVRGRAGGIRLARPADEIRLGEVLRMTEEGFDLVDCANCVIAPACGLTAVVNEALRAFLAVFDSYSLGDILGRRDQLLAVLDAQRRVPDLETA